MAENITTAAGRARLEPRAAAYWHRLQKGRDVGYRAGPGTWSARILVDGKRKFAALDGARTFDDAKLLAEKFFTETTAGIRSEYTVDAMIADYVEHCRINQSAKSAHRAELSFDKHVLPHFAGRQVASLTTPELNKWRLSLLPKAPADDAAPVDEAAALRAKEAMRSAKSTANRIWASFRAAMSLAFANSAVPSDEAWRRVKGFPKADKARDFYPTPQQVAELLKHCAPAFRPLVQAAALTGFRLQPLTAATVADFDPVKGTLQIRNDKGHARTATLSSAAVELFKAQARDKLPAARLFLRADGFPWGPSHQDRPFRAACTAAKLPRDFLFYSLRHYFISRALAAGMNVNALANNVGTSPTMIHEHYAKFIPTEDRAMLDRIAL